MRGVKKRTKPNFFFRMASIFKNATTEVLDNGRVDDAGGYSMIVDGAPAAKEWSDFWRYDHFSFESFTKPNKSTKNK